MKLEFNFNQSGVIPYRITENGLEVLLISSLKKKKWIIPKGYIEFNLTPFESAKKEAFEEAGVLGTNETIELGSFKIDKAIGICYIIVFSMEVTEVLEDYPDKETRKRQWFKIEDAIKNTGIPQVAELLMNLKRKLKEVQN